MKYVIMIHSNPRPWGHPTTDYLPEWQSKTSDERERLNREFDAAFADMIERGEFVTAEALGDPSTSRLFRWVGNERLSTDGPYAEGKEHFAGFFLIDVETHERATEIATFFSGPGETVELRPVMSGGSDQE